MRREDQVARAFLVEAHADLRSARILHRDGEHARSVALAQQAIEKVLKAMLATQGLFPDTHEVSEPFRSAFADLPDVDLLADIASRMEDIGVRSRYPLFRRPDRPIWIPSERYGEADSQQALDEATTVLDALSQYLTEQHGMQP